MRLIGNFKKEEFDSKGGACMPIIYWIILQNQAIQLLNISNNLNSINLSIW